MKNILFPALLLWISFSLHAQYYYQDIIGTRDLNQLIQRYRDNKVSTAEGTGYDADGLKNSDFSETHNFFPAQQVLKIATRNKADTSNEYYRFDASGHLISVSDTTSAIVSTTSYAYDGKNDPVLIKNMVNDAHDSVYENEQHQWFYNADGRPVKMLRIVNNTDTTDVRFTLDAKGNVIEEWPFIHRISREKMYYYYDDKNRLTDIVRYNLKAGRLLPDYMFEYSATNQVIQKITTLSSAGVGYLTWRYAYDEKGLKTTEASFNKNKERTGTIKYSYQFGQ